MAINGPSIDIEQDNTSGGNSFNPGEKIPVDINNIIYFKDTIPSYEESDCVDQTNIERLKELLLSWGFLDVVVSEVSLWKIATQYSSGPRLEWKGNLYAQTPGLQYLKCKNKDKSSYQGCYDLYSSNYILLNTHASGYANADWKWIHISELGFGMDVYHCYKQNTLYLPYIKLKDVEKKYYVSTDSNWEVVNKNNYFASAYTFNIPNYFISDKMMEGSSWHKETITKDAFNFSKELKYPFDNSKNAKNFYFQEYVYLLFNNFNSSFSKGSTVNYPFYLNQTETSITIRYKNLSKSIEKKPDDKIYLYIRQPGIVKSTAQSKWHYYAYADRMWHIGWRRDFDLYVGDANEYSVEEIQHSFYVQSIVEVFEIPNGNYTFNGEEIPSINSWPKVSTTDPKYTSFVGSKTYEKTESISSNSLDTRLFNSAFASSGPGIDYSVQQIYTRWIGPGGTDITYSEEQTKHVFTLEYEYFLWPISDSSFSWDSGASSWGTIKSWSGEDNQAWLAAYMVWRCVVNEIGVMQWGYAKEPQIAYVYDSIGTQNAKMIPYAEPTGSFTYHGVTYSNLDMETQSTYTEMSYSQGEKPNVRGAFSHGLLVNTQNLTHVNTSNSAPFAIKTGYSNEPAIALVLFSKNPDVTGLEVFNTRN